MVSGDLLEYEVSSPAVNFLNFSFPDFICCLTHSAETTCFFRSKFGKIRPVAFPRRPSILFFQILVPFGVFWMIFCSLSSGRPALSLKEKNQWTQPGFGSSFSSSLISFGVSSSHSGRGLEQLIYSFYTSRFGSSGFNVAIR